MVLLAVAGLCINIFLLTRTLGDAAIAGCGGGPCDEVLASRWSSLLGLPIPAFGILVYALLLLSLFQRLEILRLPLLGGIAGAAFWFIAVQAFILGKFCPWCMAAHGVGLAIVICGILLDKAGAWSHVSAWAGLAVFAVVSMQVFGPVKSGHRIEGAQGTMPKPQHSASVSFNDGRFVYQLAEHPRIGPADADRVLVEYFDYQCPACLVMAGYLEALVAAHPGRLAVLLMPVPLEHGCNPHLGANRSRVGSCAIARIALAVWRQRPDDFPAFHRKLIAAPSAAAARSLALELMDDAALTAALADPWIDQTIASHADSWAGLSSSNDKLPKLLIRGKRILHGLPSGEDDFLRVMKQELGF
jgi:uncharacterized membrane protein/protein-disulfide isomerase